MMSAPRRGLRRGLAVLRGLGVARWDGAKPATPFGADFDRMAPFRIGAAVCGGASRLIRFVSGCELQGIADALVIRSALLIEACSDPADREWSGSAAATIKASQQSGMTIGVATLGTIVSTGAVLSVTHT